MRKVLLFLFLIVTSSAYSQVVLNEICPANADIIYDPNFFNFSGWVELHNTSSSAVTVGGYYLSDKESDPFKWRIPAGTSIPANGYLLIWCDDLNTGRHTNFSLDSEGEDVVMSNAAGVLFDKITFPKQFTNIAYGRTTNGNGAWNFLSNPTPGSANNPATATQQLVKPHFSIAGGRYSVTQQLTLAHEQVGAEIRYTTDGSEPTSASTLFTGSIQINQTKTIKAKAFLNGFLPGQTETHTYFVNEHAFSIPVISISTKPDYLYDNTIGIYVEGTNGVSGYCNASPVNWNQDWDRHAVFEYFDKNGNRVFNQSVDIRIGGNCSRNQPQKSFAIKARDKYGSNIMNYKFFDKSVNQFGGLMLRNSGNDFNISMFRDALMQKLPVEQMDIDYMDYQPTIVYLNGEYMGIQNLREKIDADYMESNFNIDKDDLDLIETYENALEGTNEAYLTYRTALEGMDRSTPAAFAFIDQNIDVQEYINYLVAEIFYCNTDWPGNNIKFWRQRSTNGKFRWILWDTDFGFALYEGASWATHPTLNFATATDGPGWPNPPWSTLHIRLVLENPIFRSRFIQTMNAALNTTFEPDRVINVINQFQAGIDDEMPFHKARWWGSVGDWNFEVQRLRDFAVERNVYLRQHMAEYFGLNETVKISIAVKEGEGKYQLNEIVTDEALQEESYFKGLPLQVEPVPAMGYAFKEWKIKKRESSAVPLVNAGAVWKYFDQNSTPAGWNTESFNDGTWAQGPAQFGYGEGDEATVVSYGPNPNNKFITTYFRKSFSIADTVGLIQLSGTILVDDGAVLNLNGLEVHRNNMPGGVVNNSTLALGGTVENFYTPFTIPKGLIKPGVNVIAVEVHQNGVTSTDVSFDLSLNTVRIGNEVEITSTIEMQQDTAYTDLVYEAYFEPSGTTLVTGIVVNEISASPSSLLDNAGEAEDWIELYNAGTETVNLAGLYITDNLNTNTKHQLLNGSGMVMEPGTYKILWADEDLNQGADHLDFKLSADGEAVGLYQLEGENTNILNEVVFPSQLKEGSFSRLPNGLGPLVFISASTPGLENQVVTGIEDEISVSVYPNPVSTVVIIDSPTMIQAVELLDCMGRSLQSFTNIQHQEISMLNNPSGIYILRLKSGSRLKTLKIIKE